MPGSYTLDFDDFKEKFFMIVDSTIPEIAGQGLFQAGSLLIRDAITQTPYAPHKRGFLWRSQDVKITEPAQQSLVAPIEVTAGFNIVYAAYLHDVGKPDWHWTLAGSGPNYLASKLADNREIYMQAVADYIFRHGGGG